MSSKRRRWRREPPGGGERHAAPELGLAFGEHLHIDPDSDPRGFLDRLEKLTSVSGLVTFEFRGMRIVALPAEEMGRFLIEHESLLETLDVAADAESVAAIRAGLTDETALELDEVRRMVAERDE